MWIANAYAKINLGLHVLERLPTGYHAIETGFCFIEWNDRFEVTASEDYCLNISDDGVPSDESNLITIAYRAFEKYIGLKRHYSFSVTKNIPAGAGLGGGSSNAAMTLRILNKLEETDLSKKDLIDLGRGIGADVPLFLFGEAGIGTGLGTEIEPADIQPDAWILTVWPGFESSTSQAYELCEPNPDPIFSIKSVLLDEEMDQWQYLLKNDLEPPVIARHAMVGNIKDQLLDFGALFSSMSGSGSSVFGIFEQDFVAIQAYESFHELGFLTNLTRPAFQPDFTIYRKD
ncbi:MAG: 4-(cytidine 5'-diphospho)-2-C-methyl-D-erythritol kinase [Bacteroidetes bacterium]|jgi:4-diphosphocytidyl-2-C-methyl-D-erythritol kinase|nr:4-(cytidine 5'-diphospho)-2-C-methyl-D-erythritol kinase [Bacteroidota bacterium]